MEKTYLLDTNIVSELTKPYKDENVVQQIERLESQCAISAVTYQEIAYGIKLMPEGKRKKERKNFFYGYVLKTFPVIDYTAEAAECYSELASSCEKKGRPRPASDTQIASTAKANSMVLVTRNKKDFAPFEKFIKIEDWFRPPKRRK